MRIVSIGIFSASFFVPAQLSAQFLKKVVDFLTVEPNAARAAEDSTLYPNKLVGTPFVNYRPETGVAVGVGADYVFKMPNSGGADRTRTSSIPVGLTYTFKN